MIAKKKPRAYTRHSAKPLSFAPKREISGDLYQFKKQNEVPL